jgi:hypothetical protein
LVIFLKKPQQILFRTPDNGCVYPLASDQSTKNQSSCIHAHSLLINHAAAPAQQTVINQSKNLRPIDATLFLDSFRERTLEDAREHNDDGVWGWRCGAGPKVSRPWLVEDVCVDHPTSSFMSLRSFSFSSDTLQSTPANRHRLLVLNSFSMISPSLHDAIK